MPAKKKKKATKKQKLYRTFFLGTGYVETASNSHLILVHKTGFKTPTQALLEIRKCIAKQFWRDVEEWRKSKKYDWNRGKDTVYARTTEFVNEMWIHGNPQTIDHEFDEDLIAAGFDMWNWPRSDIPRPFVLIDCAGESIADANKGNMEVHFDGFMPCNPHINVME